MRWCGLQTKFIRIIACTAFAVGCVADLAEARLLGQQSNGNQPGHEKYETEEYKNRYHISCVSKINNPAVFIAPNKSKRYKSSYGNEDYELKKGADIIVDRIVEENNTQFLSGRILYYRQGGDIFSLEKPKSEGDDKEDIDRLYVLPKDWDCGLTQNNGKAELSCETVKHAYSTLSELYLKNKKECVDKGE